MCFHTVFPHSYKVEKAIQAASQSQAITTLFDTLLRPEKGTDGQDERSIVEKINLKCLDEEAQICNRTGDLARLTQWRLSAERLAQLSLLGSDTKNKPVVENNRTSYLDAPFDNAFQACSHFEVQLSSSLTQKGRSDVDLGLVGGQGTTDYSAQLGTVVTLKANAQNDLDMLMNNALVSRLENGLNSVFLFPRGLRELPYVNYRLSETTHSQAAVLQTTGGTKGVTGDCTAQGTGTTSGQLYAVLIPVFKPDPDAHDDPAPDGPSPDMSGLSPLEKRDLIRKRTVSRILAHTSKVGLLAPPRVLDVKATLLDLNVGQPAEHATSTCHADHKPVNQDFTTWLESWNAFWSKKPDVAKATAVGIAVSEKGWTSRSVWELNPWDDTKTFPLKFSVDVPKHEDAGGITFDQTWHVDIIIVHTPKGSTP